MQPCFSPEYELYFLKLSQAKPTSVLYIAMTTVMMAEFGVAVERVADDHYRVPNTGGYVNPPACDVEADASSATYPLAMAAISGGDVTVLGVGSASLQGDARFAHCATNLCVQRTVIRTVPARAPQAGGPRVFLTPLSVCLPLSIRSPYGSNGEIWRSPTDVTIVLTPLTP